MNIRPAAATLEDMAAIRALAHELDVIEEKNQPEHFFIIERTEEMMRKFIDDPEADYLLAEEAGQVVGYILLHEKEILPGSSLVPHKFVYAYELIVSANARKGGYGKALLAAARDWGKARNLAYFRLSVLPKNEKALAVYQSQGMEICLIDMECKL